MDRDAVILAVASPLGFSERGLVRASGGGVFRLLRDRLVGEEGLRYKREARMARIKLGDSGAELPVILLTMPGPASFTGEDTVELLLPGNPTLLERVADDWIAAGRRLGIETRRAGPGEFSARAYLNNKLSLTEAEGVNAIITAKSDAELRAAKMLTSGRLGEVAGRFAEDLAKALAMLEAGIDFTDQEDVIAITAGDLLGRVLAIRDGLRAQLERAVGFESLVAIPRVVLVGPPNAGKSTLFNALLGRRRVVVSDVAGTTRDVIEEPLKIGDSEVMLIDMAGLDAGDKSWLNARMQQAARHAIERADLLVECVSASDLQTNRKARAMLMRSTVADQQDKTTIEVVTKVDLLNGDIRDSSHAIAVSAHDGSGVKELRCAIWESLQDSAITLAADTLALQPRHDAAMRYAIASLDEAISLIEVDAAVDAEGDVASSEIVAASLRSGLDALAGLAGEMSPDDVLGFVFAGFCVGK